MAGEISKLAKAGPILPLLLLVAFDAIMVPRRAFI